MVPVFQLPDSAVADDSILYVLQLTYPLDTLRLRLAVDPRVVGMRGAARALMKEGAGLAFYRGIGVAMLGTLITWAICAAGNSFCLSAALACVARPLPVVAGVMLWCKAVGLDTCAMASPLYELLLGAGVSFV